MSERYKANETHEIYFVTLTVVQWTDVFTRRDFNEIICDSLAYCQKEKGLTLYAWCIMTNHLHLICSATSLPDVIRDFKKYTSREIIKAIEQNPLESRKGWLLWLFKSAGENSNKNEVFKFWQTGYHPILLDTNLLIDQRLNYLHQNPVKAGFVEEPEDWFYSSAKDYAGRTGRLSITFIN